MRMRIAAVATFAGSLLLAPVVANAGHGGGGHFGGGHLVAATWAALTLVEATWAAPALLVATWAAPALRAAVGMAAVVTLPGMVAIVLGMATIGMATITITSTTITSPITATSTIASTTASWQSELVVGGPATIAMGMVMAGALGFITRLRLPGARIGGTDITPARATTDAS